MSSCVRCEEPFLPDIHVGEQFNKAGSRIQSASLKLSVEQIVNETCAKQFHLFWTYFKMPLKTLLEKKMIFLHVEITA